MIKGPIKLFVTKFGVRGLQAGCHTISNWGVKRSVNVVRDICSKSNFTIYLRSGRFLEENF
jgi:hypothetical protein